VGGVHGCADGFGFGEGEGDVEAASAQSVEGVGEHGLLDLGVGDAAVAIGVDGANDGHHLLDLLAHAVALLR